MPMSRPSLWAAVVLVLAACDTSPPASVIDAGDWPHYARDLAATKYSPLDQIDASNVSILEIGDGVFEIDANNVRSACEAFWEYFNPCTWHK